MRKDGMIEVPPYQIIHEYWINESNVPITFKILRAESLFDDEGNQTIYEFKILDKDGYTLRQTVTVQNSVGVISLTHFLDITREELSNIICRLHKTNKYLYYKKTS